MTPVETQPLVAPDVHSFTAPSAAANTIIPIASLIPERAFYISLMNMIVRPAVGRRKGCCLDASICQDATISSRCNTSGKPIIASKTNSIEVNMNSCCSASGCDNKHPRKHRCPVNSREYAEVSGRTIAHHIKESWGWVSTAARYYFCDDSECDVAYFGDDDSLILKSQLRTRIGVKEEGDDDLLCYCFCVSKAEFERKPAIKNFVVVQTKAGLCSCDTRNPSGRCCL
ncbi:putative iron-sulfur cluster-binding metallochaperone [Polaromonas sp. UBA4122]|uniref:putative iron-sulfur cluster-binding metallochaperone n=1 Tax=Polaromonas sp. UBA4122 TaxID=1947074 RepID=UPI0025DEEF73|nr:hypothetical protein [Polaromonas sp. UBA4122]